MPKMVHWNSPDPIEVSPAKAAVYRAQGWVAADSRVKDQPTNAVTRATADPVEPAPDEEPVEAPKPVKKAAKKAPAKKTAAKKTPKQK